MDELSRLIGTYRGISLDEMDSIRLMNRIDTKFVTTVEVLLRVLESARDLYRALDAGQGKISPYNSIYFDTPSRDMYIRHHDKRLVRRKVRTRVYLSSNDTYLEIKRKNNTGRTKKKRMEVPPEALMDYSVADGSGDFIRKWTEYDPASLAPMAETRFDRITLVDNALTERITIDLNLVFTSLCNGRKVSLGNAVIIELKQSGHAGSEMRKILLRERVHPFRVSKYCIATALTEPGVKANRFKLKIRQIEKITGNKPVEL